MAYDPLHEGASHLMAKKNCDIWNIHIYIYICIFIYGMNYELWDVPFSTDPGDVFRPPGGSQHGADRISGAAG